jgi:hypothetical protein
MDFQETGVSENLDSIRLSLCSDVTYSYECELSCVICP